MSESGGGGRRANVTALRTAVVLCAAVALAGAAWWYARRRRTRRSSSTSSEWTTVGTVPTSPVASRGAVSTAHSASASDERWSPNESYAMQPGMKYDDDVWIM